VSMPPLGTVWVALALTAVVIALSLSPESSSPKNSLVGWIVYSTGTPMQKAAHLVLYAGLVVVWWWALASRNTPRSRAVFVFAIVVVFGSALEYLQTYIPGRFGSLSDVALDSIGAGIGAGIALYLPRNWH